MTIILRILGSLFLVESLVIDFYNFRDVLARAPYEPLGYINSIAAATPTFASAIAFFAIATLISRVDEIYRPRPY